MIPAVIPGSADVYPAIECGGKKLFIPDRTNTKKMYMRFCKVINKCCCTLFKLLYREIDDIRQYVIKKM